MTTRIGPRPLARSGRAHFEAVVIGAGQAGLAVSHELTRAGIAHVVLERARIGQTWRRHWDSFSLVTPNWSVQLPGHRYDGDDPDGFMLRDEVVSYLARYAAGFEAPVREGVDVTSLRPGRDGRFILETSGGRLTARNVVVCTGAYQRPHRPDAAATLPTDLVAIDVDDYRNPPSLPPGPVLIVGSGQSGCQIAEELHESGREVFLACGRTSWLPRRLAHHDAFWWMLETGFLDTPLSALPSPAARLEGNRQATGRGGGHDLHLRTLHRSGVTLLGHLLGAHHHRARFAPDLLATVAWGDQQYAYFTDMIRTLAVKRGMAPSHLPAPEPLRIDPPEQLNLRGFGAVVFASGFRPDYRSWVHIPGAFDHLGFPIQHDGASTVISGLYFLGVHYLRKRKSSFLIGVGEDAAIVADRIVAGMTPARRDGSAPPGARPSPRGQLAPQPVATSTQTPQRQDLTWPRPTG
jgi:putative flavoprotein involved in K+ transport